MERTQEFFREASYRRGYVQGFYAAWRAMYDCFKTELDSFTTVDVMHAFLDDLQVWRDSHLKNPGFREPPLFSVKDREGVHACD